MDQKSKRKLLLGGVAMAAVILALGGPVLAAESQDQTQTKIYQLDEVVVSSEDSKAEMETPNMEVIDPDRFPMSLGGTLDTVLERQPGIQVQRIQQLGTAIDDDSIKIRGFGARRLKVTRNGRLMNTSGVAGGYFIDWNQMPLYNVENVEVIKGVADPRYGNVLGGVVNLVLKKPPRDAPRTEVSALYGSYDSWGGSLYHGWKPGRFEYSIAARKMESDGYLWNGEQRFTNVDLHLGYDLPTDTYLWADVLYSKQKKGFIVPNRVSQKYGDPGYNSPINPDYPASDGEYMYGGMGAYPEPGSWWEKERWLFEVGAKQDLKRYGELELRYWQNHGDREAYNTRRSMNRVFHKKFFDDRSWGLDGSYTVDVGDHTIRVGASYDYLQDDGDENYADDFRDSFRNGYYVAAKNLGAYTMADLRFMDKKLWITPGVRYESYDGESGPGGEVEDIPDISMDGWAPSLKITYNYSKGSLVYVSAARALRMPTPPEHYWHYDPDDAGVDTSKLPFEKEDGLMLQAGWRTMLPTKTQIEISPYYYRIKDYIQFDLINFVAYNIDQAEIWGAEFQISQQLPYGFSAFLNYTFQKSKTKGDPFVANFVNPVDRDFDEVPGLPEHIVNLGLQFKAENGAKVAAFVHLVSSQKVIYNGNELWNTDLRVRDQDGYTTVDLEASYPFLEYFTLSAFARNILDEDYQERFGYPAAGATYGVILTAKF
ncbi:MAG: TonB-dependent receptor [Desulfarculaceae bacterium]|jgi:outer membrane receptor protein involved in Fe transport